MAHLTSRSGYQSLVERLNKAPQAAPPSETLYKILSLLFSEEEARLTALLPLKPFTSKLAAKAWKKPIVETEAVLDKLASRGIVLDFENFGESLYLLPPPMAGFFEFSMMRYRKDIDQKAFKNKNNPQAYPPIKS